MVKFKNKIKPKANHAWRNYQLKNPKGKILKKLRIELKQTLDIG